MIRRRDTQCVIYLAFHDHVMKVFSVSKWCDCGLEAQRSYSKTLISKIGNCLKDLGIDEADKDNGMGLRPEAAKGRSNSRWKEHLVSSLARLAS